MNPAEVYRERLRLNAQHARDQAEKLATDNALIAQTQPKSGRDFVPTFGQTSPSQRRESVTAHRRTAMRAEYIRLCEIA